MARRLRFLVLLFAVLCSLRVLAAGAFDARIRRYEELVRQRMKSDGAVGLTVGFVQGDFTWVQAFGYADLENGVPAKSDSSYRMASVAKPMTAAAVLTLVEQGKVDLDAEVQTYVPSYPRKKHPITIRQLLGHVGGTATYRTMAEETIKVHKSTRESIAILADADLVAEPDTRFSYSNYGYILLRAVIESVSGKSYGEFLRENVWGPLGMLNTRVDDPLDIIPGRVRGYQLVDGKVKSSEFVDMSSRLGAGGIRSTVPDLLSFARGLLQGKILTAATRERMWTSMITRGGRWTNYGMGWFTGSRNGRFVVYHGGGANETRTYLLLVPRENFAAAVAANFEGADIGPYAQKLYETILDERWNLGVYTDDAADRLMLDAMDAAFDEGMRHFDRHRVALTSDPRELAEAFAYFNDIAMLPVEQAEERIGNGRHPVAGQPFAKMVSYIGSRVRETTSETRFNTYYRDGAIPLFADYIAWYHTTPKHPAELKFSDAFERSVARWKRDWAKTWNAETRSVDVHEGSDLPVIAKRLHETFKGASVYPNLEYDFESLARGFMAHGNLAKALEAGRIALDLYPRSAQANGMLAVTYAVAGEEEKALSYLRRSKELDPNDEASAPVLVNSVYGVASRAGVEAGLRLAALALQMYPRDVDLHDARGELYLMAGRKEEAIAAFREVVAIDPEAANAKQRLSELTEP